MADEAVRQCYRVSPGPDFLLILQVRDMPGLFLAGGGVHPGPGVPMAALSGQSAAATTMAHLDSISRSRRVPIAGGTSTRSATTTARSR